MRSLQNLMDNYILGYDWLCYIRHFGRKFLDKGLHIYSSYMLYFWGNHCLKHILVCILCKGRLDIQASKCIHHLNTECLHRMEKDCMGLLQWVLALKLACNNTEYKDNKCYFTWLGFWVAVSEWVTCISFIAGTYWGMVNYITLSTYTTGAGARVNTFFAYTSQITRTFWIYCALWSAIRWASKIIWQTRTWWSSSYIVTLGIGTTWRR